MAIIVYVLTNEAMSGFVKIGKTSRDDVKVRMGELYTTGVPFPFDCAIAIEVEDEQGHRLERALRDDVFGPERVNRSREFFKIKTSQVVELLKIWPGAKDVTPEVERDLDKNLSSEDREATRKFREDREDREATRKFRKARRPNLDFKKMGIPEGSKLVSTHEDREEAIVRGSRKVSFRGEEMYLTAATQMALNLDYAVPPLLYWTFEGRNLSEIYFEAYPDPESIGGEEED